MEELWNEPGLRLVRDASSFIDSLIIGVIFLFVEIMNEQWNI